MRARHRIFLAVATGAPWLVACSLLTRYDIGGRVEPEADAASPDVDAEVDADASEPDAPTPQDGSVDAGPCTETPCAVQLVAGGPASCARMSSSGEVWCWGDNATGIVGASAPGVYPTPVKVKFNGPVDEIFMGAWGRWPFACARRGGIVECWGDDGGADPKPMKLGRGTSVGSFVPVPAPVVGLTGADEIALGGDRSCARIGTTMSCWGRTYERPVTVDSSPKNVPVPKPVRHVVVGREHACALLDSEEIACAGYLLAYTPVWDDASAPGQAGMAIVPGVMGVAQMSESTAHVCVLKKDGSVLCWGRDTFGQLGRGAFGTYSLAPAVVTLPSPAKSIAAGHNHTCALLTNETVWCWGRNESTTTSGSGYTKGARRPRGMVGALPDGSVDSAVATPRKIGGLPDEPLVSVVAGYDHSCALTAGGAVYCWGGNAHGELGRGKAGGGVDDTPHPIAAKVVF